MIRKHIILGVFSAAFGVCDNVFRLPFPNDMMALVTAFPPSWVTLFTTLFLPFVLIVAGVVLAFSKPGAGYVLAATYLWLFAIYVWATLVHLFGPLSSPVLITLQHAIAWGLIAGVVFYGLLAMLSAAVARAGGKYNKSLEKGTGVAGAS